MELSCVLSSDSKRCAECAKAGRSCDCTGVPLSAWKSVERALEKLQREEREAEQDKEALVANLAAVHARIIRIRKLKKLQEDRETELIRRDAITLDEMDEAAGYPGLPGNNSPPSESFIMPTPSFWEDLGLPIPAVETGLSEPGPSSGPRTCSPGPGN